MRWYIFLFGILMSSCNQLKPAASSDCEDFDMFMLKFGSDSIFQEKHVEFPYMFYYSDEDLPLDMKERLIDSEDHEYIDFSNDENSELLESNPYKVTVIREKDSVFYLQRGINNYKNITYKFAYKEDCWYLVEKVDNTD